MKKLILLASLFSQVHGEIKIITEQLTFGTGFTFEKIPAPATNDLGTTAKFSLISGQFDRHGAGPEALQDGKVPAGDDEPRRNFFFAADTDGGRLLVDLGETEKLERLTTYSRHFKNRAPQVYTVYGSKSDKAPSPDIDLTKNGWSQIAKIDTRNPKKVMGGRHAANITGDLGSYRISANFIDWVSRTHKKDLARLINDDARNGRYQENLWKKHTGKSLQKLE